MLVMILKYNAEILLLQEQHSRIININELKTIQTILDSPCFMHHKIVLLRGIET